MHSEWRETVARHGRRMETIIWPTNTSASLLTLCPDHAHMHSAMAGSPKPVTNAAHNWTRLVRIHCAVADIVRHPGTACTVE
eukprot:6388218-Amphidinium_carterae.1